MIICGAVDNDIIADRMSKSLVFHAEGGDSNRNPPALIALVLFSQADYVRAPLSVVI